MSEIVGLVERKLNQSEGGLKGQSSGTAFVYRCLRASSCTLVVPMPAAVL